MVNAAKVGVQFAGEKAKLCRHRRAESAVELAPRAADRRWSEKDISPLGRPSFVRLVTADGEDQDGDTPTARRPCVAAAVAALAALEHAALCEVVGRKSIAQLLTPNWSGERGDGVVGGSALFTACRRSVALASAQLDANSDHRRAVL